MLEAELTVQPVGLCQRHLEPTTFKLVRHHLERKEIPLKTRTSFEGHRNLRL